MIYTAKYSGDNCFCCIFWQGYIGDYIIFHICMYPVLSIIFESPKKNKKLFFMLMLIVNNFNIHKNVMSIPVNIIAY